MTRRSIISLMPDAGFTVSPPEGMDYVVEVDAIQGCWLSAVAGDPGRTLDPAYAMRYDDIGRASGVLTRVRAAFERRKFSIGLLPKLQVAAPA